MPYDLKPDPDLNSPDPHKRRSAAEKLCWQLRPALIKVVRARFPTLPAEDIATAANDALGPVLGGIFAREDYWHDENPLAPIFERTLKVARTLMRAHSSRNRRFAAIFPFDEQLEADPRFGPHWALMSQERQCEIDGVIRKRISRMPLQQRRVATIYYNLLLENSRVTARMIWLVYKEEFDEIHINTVGSHFAEVRKIIRHALEQATFIPKIF